MIHFENNIDETMDFPVEIFIQDTMKGPVLVPEHWHSCIEFLFVMEGSAEHIINGNSYEVTQNQLVVILNGDIHAIYCNKTVPTKIFVLKFSPSMVHPKYRNCYQSKYLSAFMCHTKTIPLLTSTQIASLLQLFQGMEKEMQDKQTGYEFIIRGYILQFIGYLTREKMIGFTTDNIMNQDNIPMEHLIQYIEEHYDLDINLSKIAADLHMNYSYASRYFKKATGKNFKQFLDFVRVSEVNKLLVESRKSMTEISAECGFSCPQAMNRTYKRLMGQNPTRMRKQI